MKSIYRGPAPFHRLTPNKRFEPVFSTVIMAVCCLFNRMLLLTDLIPVHLVYCGQTVMIGCNHTSFEWTRAVRHIYGIIRHMQGLYYNRPVLKSGPFSWYALDMQYWGKICFFHDSSKEVSFIYWPQPTRGLLGLTAGSQFVPKFQVMVWIDQSQVAWGASHT